jgi:hypothetical protein
MVMVVVKTFLIYVISGILLIGLAGVVISFMSTQNAEAIKTGKCPVMEFLWKHTFGAGLITTQNHSRLQELTPACVILEGVINDDPKDPEGDGDLHFNVTPDPGFEDLLDKKTNKKGMVVEIICWDKPNYKKYDKWGNFCEGVNSRQHINYNNPDKTPKYGDHVRVIGKWVKDVGYPKPDHAQWNEIHPAEIVQKIP